MSQGIKSMSRGVEHMESHEECMSSYEELKDSTCGGFRGSLTIGNAVIEIGVSAFSGCSGLTTAVLLPTRPPTPGGLAFPSTVSSIQVPAGSLAAYKVSK